MTFDLVDRPWLPVVRDGQRIEVSLRTTLTEAPAIQGLAPAVPTQLPALIRQVLLPVLLDALGPPESDAQWADWFRRGGFSPGQLRELNDYLDRWRHRFDLFDPAQPFAQVGGLRTERGDTKSAALLVPASATGNNVPLFSNRTDGDVMALTPAEAAVWLVHAHCWDTAAIKTGAKGDQQVKAGKTTGNPTGPLGQLGVIVPMGRTLFDSLLLNLPIVADGRASIGIPQWRRMPVASAEWAVRPADGLLDVLTWQSRRIRLFPETTPDGVRVTRVIVAAGDRLANVVEDEPHTAWRVDRNPKAGRPPRRPRRHVAAKAAWRGMDCLLAIRSGTQDGNGGFETSRLLAQIGGLQADECLPANYPLRAMTCGVVYGNQSAVVEDVIVDALPLPVAALVADHAVRHDVLDVADQAERLAGALNTLSADLRRAQGGDPLPWDKGQRPGDQLIHALDPLVRRVLAGIQRDSDDPDRIEQGLLAWEMGARSAAWQLADLLLAATAPSAFAGRATDHGIYREATAELRFRRQVRQILTRLTEPPDSPRDENDG